MGGGLPWWRTLVIGGSRYPGAVSADGWRQRSTPSAMDLLGGMRSRGTTPLVLDEVTGVRIRANTNRLFGFQWGVTVARRSQLGFPA